MSIVAIPLDLKAESMANCDLWVAKVVSIEGQVKVRENAKKRMAIIKHRRISLWG